LASRRFDINFDSNAAATGCNALLSAHQSAHRKPLHSRLWDVNSNAQVRAATPGT